MKKRDIYLLIWSGCFALTCICALIFDSLEEGSAIQTVFSFITVAFLVAGIVFVICWKNTCSLCKEGKMVFIGNEDGESYTTTSTIKTGTSTVKNKHGEVIRTFVRTAEVDFLVTPILKICCCNKCGNEVRKVRHGKSGKRVERI